MTAHAQAHAQAAQPVFSDQEIATALASIEAFDPEARTLCVELWEKLEHNGDARAIAAWLQRIIATGTALDRTGDATAAQQIGDAAATQLQTIEEALAAVPSARPTVRKQPVAARRTTVRQGAARVLGVAAILFGFALWIPGAHYQLDGWTLIANAILELVRSGIVLPLATGWWSLLLVLFGIVYSVGERKYLPIQKSGKEGWRFLGMSVLLVWLIINGTDLLSAYIGITRPPTEDAWPITKWVAATQWAAVLWTLIVVYIGDILLTIGWYMLGIRLPRWVVRVLHWLS